MPDTLPLEQIDERIDALCREHPCGICARRQTWNPGFQKMLYNLELRAGDGYWLSNVYETLALAYYDLRGQIDEARLKEQPCPAQ